MWNYIEEQTVLMLNLFSADKLTQGCLHDTRSEATLPKFSIPVLPQPRNPFGASERTMQL